MAVFGVVGVGGFALRANGFRLCRCVAYIRVVENGEDAGDEDEQAADTEGTDSGKDANDDEVDAGPFGSGLECSCLSSREEGEANPDDAHQERDHYIGVSKASLNQSVPRGPDVEEVQDGDGNEDGTPDVGEDFAYCE